MSEEVYVRTCWDERYSEEAWLLCQKTKTSSVKLTNVIQRQTQT